jgi:hypothetical protein
MDKLDYGSEMKTKTLKKEVEEDTRRCSWISRVHIMKMTIQSKVIYRLSAILIKFSMSFLTGKEKTILKFT